MNVPELKKIYLEQAVPALMKSQGYDNVHQVPKVEKVVINSSFGAEMDKNGIEELRKDIASLAGQAPVVVKAKVSVSISSSGKECLWELKLPFAETECGSFSSVSLPSPYQTSGTSEVFPQNWTDAEITLWA